MLLSPITSLFYIIYIIDHSELAFPLISFLNDFTKNHIDYFIKVNTDIFPGLLYGSAGKALAIHYGILSGALLHENEYLKIIESCFNVTSNKFGMTDGIAGQLFAACLIFKTIPSDFLRMKLTEYVKILINKQNRDSSWRINKTPKIK